MKKIAIFFFIIIAIVSTIAYLYLNYNANIKEAQRENLEFERYEEKEINGLDMTTIINKAVNKNEKNQIPKDNKGKYIDNGNNSINIDIQFLDNDTTYNMETFYNNGMQNFVYYYGEIMFKCSEIQYHNNTKKIKYMKFEQTTS